MAKKPPPAQPRDANLSPEQMRAGLKLLDRREQELRAFDVNAVTDYDDRNAEALRIKYNTTIARVFVGDDTKEYQQFSSYGFYRGPLYEDVTAEEVRQGHNKGIQEALSYITTIRELFQEELEDHEEDPTARVTRAFGELDIHPAIADAAGGLVEDAHYAEAVENACKALEALVQRLSGRKDLSGTTLMQTVFSAKGSILRVADDLSTKTGQDEQLGTMHLFEGAMLALRNPRAHSLRHDDAERAVEHIAFLSTLAKIAEGATRV